MRYDTKHNIKPNGRIRVSPRFLETTITDVQWAYLAGIIDGEGCIKSQGANNICVVSVSQMDSGLTYWISNTFVDIGNHRSYTYHQKPRHYWIVARAEDVLIVLNGCLPYLVMKQDQAKLAIELVSLPRPLMSRQEEICNSLRLLKKTDSRMRAGAAV